MNKSLKEVVEMGNEHTRWKIVEKGEEEEEHIGVEDVDNEDNLSQRPRRNI